MIKYQIKDKREKWSIGWTDKTRR